MKRRIFAVLLVLFLCGSLTVTALDVPAPTQTFFVNDYANVIDDSDEQEIFSSAVSLYRACGAQVVVVTLPSLEGDSIERVSLAIAREWGIGDKEKDNGVLLLLSAAEPRVRIEVGRGLEGAIPDSKAGRLLDTYMIPHYSPDEYSTGLRDTAKAIIGEIYVEYGMTPEDGYEPIEEEEELSTVEAIGLLLLLIGAIVLFIRHPHLFWLLLRFGGRGGNGHGGFGGGSGGGFSGGGGGFSGGGASR